MKTKIKINIGFFDISIINEQVGIFDGNAWEGVRIDIDEWQSVKEAVDKLIADNKKNQEKRQPIKRQTLHEFNIARSVSYGSRIKIEPFTDK